MKGSGIFRAPSMRSRGGRLRWAAIALALTLVVGACGDSSGDTTAPTSPPATTQPDQPTTTTGDTTPTTTASTTTTTTEPPPPAPDVDQEITIGVAAVLKNYDPISTTSLTDYVFLRLVYDNLVSVDSGRPEPWAAESWEAITPQHWRFKIRPGITFSNGEPFDANAVEFTLRRAIEGESTPWKVRVAALERMEVVDDLTIDFFLSAPVGNWPTRLSVVWIVPPSVGDADTLTTEPIGSGPFIVESYTPSESITLVRNPNFWGNPPELDRVTIRAIPEQSTRVAALQAGDIDVAHRILPDFIDQLEGDGFTVVSVPSGQSANIFFQSSVPGPLQDVRVRQAIDFAIDKEALFAGISGGLGRFLDGQIVGPNSIGYNPDVHARPYDPDRARELLAEAGYGDGVTLAFDYPVARYFRDKDMGEAISAYLEQVGITVQQNPLAAGAWLDRLYTGSWGPINYWSIQDAPAFDLSWTMEIFKTDNLRKLTADANIDEQLAQSFQITDTDERNAFLAEFAEYLHEQAHFVAFHQDPGVYAVAPNVAGVEFLPSTYINLFDARVTE